MAMDTTSPRTRRAVLTGVMSGAVALIAGALGRPLGVRGADGEIVHVGDDLAGTRTTRIATSTGGAISGVSSDPTGAGLLGWASAGEGTAHGVAGRSDSAEGTGVSGLATATSGSTRGVYGASASDGGTGVYGAARALTGVCHGVFGESDSTGGYGVSGLANATSGPTAGVFGRCASSDGAGVFGDAMATTGVTLGVAGRNASPHGIGVAGVSSAGSIGVMGATGLEAGPDPTLGALGPIGVYGEARQDGGRGGVFRGVTAQLRLMPASAARPDSGQLGDLFLEAEGTLWFCKGGSVWRQIA